MRVPVDVVKYPHPALSRISSEITRDEILRGLPFVHDMIRACIADHGIGLAANQIGLTRRAIVVWRPQTGRSRPRKTSEFTIAVNPRWVPEGSLEVIATEGCLSVPGKQARVRRYATIAAEWLDSAARPQNRIMSGLEARIWQHECDHLDGRLIISGGGLVEDPEDLPAEHPAAPGQAGNARAILAAFATINRK